MKWRIATTMILASIAGAIGVAYSPWFQNLMRSSDEQRSFRNQGSISSSLGDFYGATNGRYPSTLNELVPNFLRSIPSAEVPPYHPASNKVSYGRTAAEAVTDEGGWVYIWNPGTKELPKVFINCTHTDSRGKRFGNEWTPW